MALLEEDLPGVAKVRTDFQLREDQGLAQRLQEQEYEQHFNSNVQLRRTARHDVNVAKEIQDKETQAFQREERTRLQKLREREEQDRLHAAEMAKKLEEEERKVQDRERRDQEHAAKMAQKLKEEEDIKMAMRMQDEAMAKKIQEAEAKRLAQRQQLEESDARLARQASLQSAGRGQLRGTPQGSLSDREVQRMKQLQLQSGQRSLDATSRQQLGQDPRAVTSLPATLPAVRGPPARQAPPTPPTARAPMQLPSYDQCVPDGYVFDDGEEPQMDENERIALQEAEDERLAREMLQKEEDERKKRELEDMEFARRMQEEESSSGARRPQLKTHDQDLEMARKLQQQEEARRVKAQSSHERDMELARRLHQEEKEATKMKQKQQQSAPPQQDPDVELAMRLQREEVMRLKEEKRHRLAQQKLMEQERQQHHQSARDQRQRQQRPEQNGAPQDGSSRFAGFEMPPASDEPSGSSSAPPTGPGQQTAPPQQQGMPSDSHPFNPAATSFYSYQPGMAGVQVPRGPKAPAASAQARPSYKRNDGGKKKKK